MGLVLLAFLVPRALAQAPISPETASTGVLTSTTTIEAYVREEAVQSGLWPVLYEVLKYESGGWQNGQSQVPNPNGPNGKEDSWGVCQIHLPDHDITKEQALDVRFCVQWTIEQFKQGGANQWTGYRLYKQGLI